MKTGAQVNLLFFCLLYFCFLSCILLSKVLFIFLYILLINLFLSFTLSSGTFGIDWFFSNFFWIFGAHIGQYQLSSGIF